MPDRIHAAKPDFRLTAKVAVSPRGTLPVLRLADAFRVDPLARRPRI